MNSNGNLYLIGIDGMSPKIMERFMAEGKLPNISKLMSKGVFSKAISSIPVFTPTNWTTISTGARPGTHGVFLWGTHGAGENLDEDHFDECMTSTVCSAEYLWEAALKQGRKSVLLNYIGYPSNLDGIYHIDWFYGPNRDYFGLSTSSVYNIGETKRKRDSKWEKWAEPWDNEGKTQLELNFKNGYGKLVISLQKTTADSQDNVVLRFDRKEVIVMKGQWTDWIRMNIANGNAYVRWKLLETGSNENESVTRIYQSSIYLDNDFCSPESIGIKLMENIGPYINDDVGKLYLAGTIDRDTFLEEARYKINWIVKSFELMQKEFGVSMFFLHWHYLDSLQHSYLGRADCTGNDFKSGKDENKALDMLREGYMLADELVSKIVPLSQEGDAFLMVSDHGNIPNHHRVSLYNLFMSKGWSKIDVVEGVPKIDFSLSKVYVNLSHVYINLKGRDPDGIVESYDYEKFRDEVRSAILSIRDPDTGLSPFASVLRKEEASVAGLWGGGIGDIVLVFERGYVWSGTEVVTLKEKRVIWKTGGANHGPQPPTAETNFSSNFATFVALGPGLKKGYKRSHPIFLTDVVPTVCKMLNLKIPSQCEGSVPLDFFIGNGIRTKHDMGIAKYPIRTKTAVAPKTFKGDVTDED
jgi:predicted AlkP superfamily phosphohydrolase/phosphomutase